MAGVAVSASHRGKGIGAGLPVDGIARAYRAGIAAFALVVDPKDDAAVAFCKHHGFVTFTSAPMTLYLPLAEVARQLGIVVGRMSGSWGPVGGGLTAAGHAWPSSQQAGCGLGVDFGECLLLGDEPPFCLRIYQFF